MIPTQLGESVRKGAEVVYTPLDTFGSCTRRTTGVRTGTKDIQMPIKSITKLSASSLRKTEWAMTCQYQASWGASHDFKGFSPSYLPIQAKDQTAVSCLSTQRRCQNYAAVERW